MRIKNTNVSLLKFNLKYISIYFHYLKNTNVFKSVRLHVRVADDVKKIADSFDRWEYVAHSLDEDIRSYLDMMEDEESSDIQSVKSLLAAFLVEVRRNHTQLDRTVDKIRELNNKNLNSKNGISSENEIKPYFDVEFMKQYAREC